MNCPSCKTSNPDGSQYCMICGNPMPSQPPPAYPASGSGPVLSMRPISGGAPSAVQTQQPQTSPSPDYNYQPSSPSVAPQTVLMPDNNYVPAPQEPSTPQYVPQPYPQAQTPQQYAQPQQQQYPIPSSSQISTSFLNIWGPFAGYGARRSHIGWLMDGQAGRHSDLFKSIYKRIKERQIPGIYVDWKNFTAKGLLVETRQYFFIKKGLVSLALNVGTFGKDLFISMVTYLKPPISNFRVLAVSLMMITGFLGYFILGWAGQSAVTMSGSNSFFGIAQPSYNAFAIGVICLLGPLHFIDVLALLILFIYSVYKFVQEKDFLAALRVPPNEFNEDDLMALEKAVEQTIRSGLDDIGLNPADLKPTAVKGSEQRLI